MYMCVCICVCLRVGVNHSSEYYTAVVSCDDQGWLSTIEATC